VADSEVSAACDVGDFSQAQRAEVPGDGEHSQQEAGIPDAVDNECLVSGCAGGRTMEVETDQKIGTQADALPPYEHQDIIVRQDEGEHGEHEQVEVSEKAVVPAF